MQLKRLRITNFRALSQVNLDFDTKVSVIIGPNAIGKTTILEAVRLVKAVLAPRTQNEGQQALQSIGLLSPHAPTRMFPTAITNDSTRPMVIKCRFSLEHSELVLLETLKPKMAIQLAQQAAGLASVNAAQLVQFTSSDIGKHNIGLAEKQIDKDLKLIRNNCYLDLNLTIDFKTGQISGEFPIQGLFFGVLDSERSPSKTIFSYFPADRALPVGEIVVQLGAADIGQQLESYNSQPQLKYQRLKHTIFSTVISDKNMRDVLDAQFDNLFTKVLKGRKLKRIGLNEIGMLSILIEDIDSGNTFEIDSLSSGEKGLLLTVLLIHNTVDEFGIILLDEPELHLNPMVCKDLLRFLTEEFALGKNIQIIMCSHSPEILTAAFESSHCSLYHLRAKDMAARVRRQDQGEIRDALRRLGSSESEALLYKGTVLVEGIDDVETLQAGFSDLFRRFKIRDRGGRSVVERDIKNLQRAESKGEEIGRYYFLFDHDRKPSNLSSKGGVKLKQLDRYFLENYLLDEDVLTELSRESDLSGRPFSTIDDCKNLIKKYADKQYSEKVARETFQSFDLESVAFSVSSFSLPSSLDIATDVEKQLNQVYALVHNLATRDFRQEYMEEFAKRLANGKDEWDEKWRSACSGKRIFEDLQADQIFKGDLQKLKKRIITKMAAEQTPDFRNLDLLLRDLLA